MFLISITKKLNLPQHRAYNCNECQMYIKIMFKLVHLCLLCEIKRNVIEILLICLHKTLILAKTVMTRSFFDNLH